MNNGLVIPGLPFFVFLARRLGLLLEISLFACSFQGQKDPLCNDLGSVFLYTSRASKTVLLSRCFSVGTLIGCYSFFPRIAIIGEMLLLILLLLSLFYTCSLIIVASVILH